MITSQQFDNALKIIVDYKLQLESGLTESNINNNQYINIQNKISTRTFFILQSYYKEVYNSNLKWESLKAMNLSELKSLDYNLLRNYRGFGIKAEKKLKDVIISNCPETES